MHEKLTTEIERRSRFYLLIIVVRREELGSICALVVPLYTLPAYEGSPGVLKARHFVPSVYGDISANVVVYYSKYCFSVTCPDLSCSE